MQLKRTVLAGVLGGAVVVWVAAAATSSVRRVAPLPIAKPQSVDVSGTELAAEIERLRDRLRPDAEPVRSRDLFHYAAPRSASHAAPAAAALESPTPTVEVPAPPPFRLVGLAEEAGDPGPVRTAILSGSGDIVLVKVGDTVGARYRVAAIEAEAVDLVDLDGRATIRLQMR